MCVCVFITQVTLYDTIKSNYFKINFAKKKAKLYD